MKKNAPILIFVASAMMSVADARAEGPMPQIPVHSVTAEVGDGATNLFLNDLRKFAGLHAFSIRITPITPDDDQYLVQMWREDISILATNAAEPELFYIGFYPQDAMLGLNVVGSLVDGLRKSAPDVSISAKPE